MIFFTAEREISRLHLSLPNSMKLNLFQTFLVTRTTCQGKGYLRGNKNSNKKKTYCSGGKKSQNSKSSFVHHSNCKHPPTMPSHPGYFRCCSLVSLGLFYTTFWLAALWWQPMGYKPDFNYACTLDSKSNSQSKDRASSKTAGWVESAVQPKVENLVTVLPGPSVCKQDNITEIGLNAHILTVWLLAPSAPAVYSVHPQHRMDVTLVAQELMEQVLKQWMKSGDIQLGTELMFVLWHAYFMWHACRLAMLAPKCQSLPWETIALLSIVLAQSTPAK